MGKTELNSHQWHFVNMNSPADLEVQWISNDTAVLEEYDRCRDGHCLFSDFYVQAHSFRMKITIADLQAGAAAGLYFGDGCWDKYLGVFMTERGLEIRIPSRVPLGDTFRFEGAKRYYVLASKNMPIVSPIELTMNFTSDELSVWLNNEFVLSYPVKAVDFVQDNARIFLKAVNENGLSPKSFARFKGLDLSGEAISHRLKGRICQSGSHKPVTGVVVHVASHKNKWAMTDTEGKFTLEGLPYGAYHLVAAREGQSVSHSVIEHHGHEIILFLEPGNENPRSEDPRNHVIRDNPYECLNGTWSFDFDPENRGEDEGWFNESGHAFSKAIQVPFPWTSLAGFGEDFLAKDAELHQFNTFYANTKITGPVGWYKRTITIPEKFDASRFTVLRIGAVSGLTQAWLDGVFLGEKVDQYQPLCWSLGKLQPGTSHLLVIRVDADFDRYSLPAGKQGFWFSQCPGIWQSVCLENCEEVVISGLQVVSDFTDGNLAKAQITLKAICDGNPHRENHVADYPGFTVGKGIARRMGVEAPCQGLYILQMEYEAGMGLIAATISTDRDICHTVFHGTPGYHRTDVKQIFVQLDEGQNTLCFTGVDDERMAEEGHCDIHRISLFEIPEPDCLALKVFDPKNNCVFNTVSKTEAINGEFGCVLSFTLDHPLLWDMDEPHLYRVEARLSRGDRVFNHARSTFGVRVIKTGWAPGHSPSDYGPLDRYRYIYLNNKIVYIRGVLDQGYNPWGCYTYPYGREPIPGSMSFDIEAAKLCGYNLIRMHIKDNEPLWYSLCDESGMLVWDELPPNFYEKAANPVWRGMYYRQLEAMIIKHHYHPSVILFSPFNESWGVEGWHERSPWEDEEGQRFISNAAAFYKKGNPQVLVIDNSGYGKTEETDIIDHHSYPSGYTQSREFWRRLVDQDYPGSTFNFFNRKNGALMQDENIRELIQRNCSQPLHKLNYEGDACQSGQPVLISEFVHTDRNTRALRLFGKISGYVRMNIASQENEDTSPLTALRKWRDFGYMNKDLSPMGYCFNNSINSLVIDSPSLSQTRSGAIVELPLYGSIWEHGIPLDQTFCRWALTGVNSYGHILSEMEKGTLPCNVKRYESSFLEKLVLRIPEGVKGLILFVELVRGDKVIAGDSIQFEVLGDNENSGPLNVAQPERVVTDGFYDTYEEKSRRLFWLSGSGYASYSIHPDSQNLSDKTEMGDLLVWLHFEASSCECLNGTRVTDETFFPSKLEIEMEGARVGEVILTDHPCDERALFSNSATIENEFLYAKTGRFGYGERFSLKLPPNLAKTIIENMGLNKPIKLTFKAHENGMVLYGNRMGRYGFDPYLEIKQSC